MFLFCLLFFLLIISNPINSSIILNDKQLLTAFKSCRVDYILHKLCSFVSFCKYNQVQTHFLSEDQIRFCSKLLKESCSKLLKESFLSHSSGSSFHFPISVWSNLALFPTSITYSFWKSSYTSVVIIA